MSMTAQHSTSTKNHVPYADSFADYATMAGGSFVAADDGKFYKTEDDNVIYMLTDYSGPTFVQQTAITDAADVTFTPDDGGDWDSPPSEVAPALDELAARTTALEAGGGGGDGIPESGWVTLGATLTYSSADDPTYVVSSDTNLTAVLSVGMKIWFQNNSTDFYGFITAIGAWSGSAQLITLYGGTNYDVANSAISSPYYSTVKAPLNFPLSPSYWTVSTTNTSQCAKNSPSASTWYGDSALSPTGPSIVIPIGLWIAGYESLVQAVKAATCDVKATFSTTTNSETDSTMTDYMYSTGAFITLLAKSKVLSLAAKTTYYLDLLTTQSSMTAIQTRGDVSASKMFAICAYL